MSRPVYYDSHMHTPLCKHARGAPEEYADAAYEQGLKGIVITCHNPGPLGWSENVRMRMDEFDRYVSMVEAARIRWAGRVDVRLGLECDYLPSMESFLRDLLSKNSFHHVLGSIHPQLPYYKNLFFHNDVVNFQRIYFRHLAQAAESGLFDTLAHPDLVKNVFPDRWNVNTVMEDVRESLDRIARTGVAMELNTSGTHKAIREMNPSLQILSEMNQRSIPVVIGSDAHTPQRVAAGFSSAIELLREAGYENVHYFLERKRHVVSLEAVRLSLYQERVREDAIPRPV